MLSYTSSAITEIRYRWRN